MPGIIGASEKRDAYATLFPLVRQYLWAPDGKPPVAWDERREGSVLKRLLIHRTVSQLEVAIIGLGILRDRGQVEWLKAGQKITSRALYNSRSGVSQMFELATQAYWQTAKHRPKRRSDSHVGEILLNVLRHAEDTDQKYQNYMHSPEWRDRRERAIQRAASRCQRCNYVGAALEVHHLRYDNLGHEPDEDLQVLCVVCHGIADDERRNEVTRPLPETQALRGQALSPTETP